MQPSYVRGGSSFVDSYIPTSFAASVVCFKFSSCSIPLPPSASAPVARAFPRSDLLPRAPVGSRYQ